MLHLTEPPHSAYTLCILLFVAVSAASLFPLPGGLDYENSDLVIGWWGAGWFNDIYQVPQVCADPAYSVVILSFLYTNQDGPYPAMTFNVDNTNASAAQIAAGATGLMWMPEMAKQIKTCQQMGKKVMLSIGGGAGDVVFENDVEAIAFANQVWQLFGGDTETLGDLRPYGDVVLDGFDLDNETRDPTGYTALVYALRALMDLDLTKQYYISGAPQCPQPDANLPIEALQAMDFVNVQFYNNGNCNHGQSGFLNSVKSWSESLSGNFSNAKFFIGAIADPREGTGYIDPEEIVAEVAQIKALKDEYNLENLGTRSVLSIQAVAYGLTAGYALWDLAEAIENGFDSPLKNALVTNFGK